MRKLTGRVSCTREKSRINHSAIISVNIVDCSIAGAPSVNLAGVKLMGIDKFPFDFEIEYDDSPIVEKMSGHYEIQVRVETDGKLLYVNDTHFSIIDRQHHQIMDHVDMYVIPLSH